MNNYEPIIKPLNNEIVDICIEWLKTHNLANRGSFDGDKEKQKTGLVGEMECHYLLKSFYPDLSKKQDGFDGGIDINHKGFSYDVKTMGRNSNTMWNYANNFVASQLPYNCDRIIFTSINWKINIIEFCGWVHKIEIPKIAELYKKGDKRYNNIKEIIIEADTYEVLNKDLRDIRELL